MPKMTHWNSPEPVDVAPEKVAVYAAQGWVSVDRTPTKVQPGVTREATQESEPAKKTAAKKAPAKKTTAKKK